MEENRVDLCDDNDDEVAYDVAAHLGNCTSQGPKVSNEVKRESLVPAT